ncbi:MAG: hypothetical protein KAR57_00890 [Bacteroidales bacterium]|nr:hypothetical protein [Bacteroidales bacterium]
MKTQMKSLLVIIVMLITTSAFAQQGNRNPPTIEKRVANVIIKIEKKIEINESQKAAINDAFTVFFTKAENERNKGERPDKTVMEGLEKERDDNVKQVLSQEKYEAYLKISCQLRPRPQQQGQRPLKQSY